MKSAQIFLVLTLLTSTQALAAGIDYSGCIQFLHGESEGSNPSGKVGLLNQYGIPFTLASSGKLSVAQNSKYSLDESKLQETISYKVKVPSKGFAVNFSGSGLSFFPSDSQFEEVEHQALVSRAKDGSLKRIEVQFPSSEKDLLRHLNNGGAQGTFGMTKAFQVDFEIANGKCVPVSASNSILVEKKSDGKIVKHTLFDTQFCRELKVFMHQHPELKACSDSKLSDQLKQIFIKKLAPVEAPAFEQASFNFGSDKDGQSQLFSDPSRDLQAPQFDKSLEARLSLAAYNSKQSPISSALEILDECRNERNLSGFIDDDTLWVELPQVPASAPAEAASSTAKSI